MAESKPIEAAASATASAPTTNASSSAPKNEGNPAFRAMGLPRLRKRLPSRNWMIFFGVVGAWSGAVIYDKVQTRRIQQKYCDAVSHLADQQLRPTTMPRKVRIYLEAPPGDYLMSARDYFKEYIKPILVASALDWEVFEGRKEGDIRYKVAETIREKRRKSGEVEGFQEADLDDVINDIRQRAGISNSAERSGDMIIGRHTWKEYIRGLHEGWLGPAESMKAPDEIPTASESKPSEDAAKVNLEGKPGEISDIAGTFVKQSSTAQSAVTETTADGVTPVMSGTGQEDGATTEGEDASPTAEIKKDEAKKEEPEKPKPDLTLPLIRPNEYAAASLPSAIPETFAPSVAVGFPHLLGFLNTPIRIWRFLNRRNIAESTGAAVTAFIIAPEEDIRSFDVGSSAEAFSQTQSADEDDPPRSEFDRTLLHEERDWHKTARKPNEPGQEEKERPWQEQMVVDARLVSRMRTIDVAAFASRLGLSSTAYPGPSDLAGAAVANAAGNVLTGSSGGEDADTESNAHLGPRHRKWKGAADRLDPLSWMDMLKSAMGLSLEKTGLKPWEQGLQGAEED